LSSTSALIRTPAARLGNGPHGGKIDLDSRFFHQMPEFLPLAGMMIMDSLAINVYRERESIRATTSGSWQPNPQSPLLRPLTRMLRRPLNLWPSSTLARIQFA
jgi:hypothetical protein